MIDLTSSDLDAPAAVPAVTPGVTSTPGIVDLRSDSEDEAREPTRAEEFINPGVKRRRVEEPAISEESDASAAPEASAPSAARDESAEAPDAEAPETSAPSVAPEASEESEEPYDLGILTVDFSSSHGFACAHEDPRAKGKCCRRLSAVSEHLCYPCDGPFTARREADNEYDPNAIMILAGGAKVGYVPGRDAAILAGPLDENVIMFKGEGAPAGRHRVSFLLCTGPVEGAIPAAVMRLVER